ncbi:hypothetical protein CYMTET_20564 [Cymbomonas tetramitiformis]|uniref:Uncharacterized protein n=1 Tax=Cymbomonas tetramitiformis TaxID=36881 RepID=A0AAE0G3Y5_9CHLO|nr:hypothetical protein CYMTET_20564 [Cymbomonas tetramitiformis]
MYDKDTETFESDAESDDAMRSKLGNALYEELDRGRPFLVATFQSQLPTADHKEKNGFKRTGTAYTIPICATGVLEVDVVFGTFQANDHRIIFRNVVAMFARQLEYMKLCLEENDTYEEFIAIAVQFAFDWRMQNRFAAKFGGRDEWRYRTLREYRGEDMHTRLWLASAVQIDAHKRDVTEYGSMEYAVFQLETGMQRYDNAYHFQDYKYVLSSLFNALIQEARARNALDDREIEECERCVAMVKLI